MLIHKDLFHIFRQYSFMYIEKKTAKLKKKDRKIFIAVNFFIRKGDAELHRPSVFYCNKLSTELLF